LFQRISENARVKKFQIGSQIAANQCLEMPTPKDCGAERKTGEGKKLGPH
jgi:hypothetical protein